MKFHAADLTYINSLLKDTESHTKVLSFLAFLSRVSVFSFAVTAPPHPKKQSADCQEAHSQCQQVIYKHTNVAEKAPAVKVQQQLKNA